MESHLLQMRGLKHKVVITGEINTPVASFTDAWIETVKTGVIRPKSVGRIFYRCVD